MSLDQLYQQIILEHSKARHGSGLAGAAAPDGASSGQSHQLNPACGDEITLRVAVADGKVSEVRWDGDGCSISMASASVLTDLAEGLTGGTARRDRQLPRGAALPRQGRGRPGDPRRRGGVRGRGALRRPGQVRHAVLGRGGGRPRAGAGPRPAQAPLRAGRGPCTSSPRPATWPGPGRSGRRGCAGRRRAPRWRAVKLTVRFHSVSSSTASALRRVVSRSGSSGAPGSAWPHWEGLGSVTVTTAP